MLPYYRLYISFVWFSPSVQSQTTLPTVPTPTTIPAPTPSYPAVIPVSSNCSARLDLNWCFLDLEPEPEGCLTFGGVLSALTPGLGVGQLLQTDSKYNPASWTIDSAYIDRCSQSVRLSTTLPFDFDLIPDFLRLLKPDISLFYDFSSDDYEIQFASLLTLGRKRFRVVVTKSNGFLEIQGKAIGAEVRIGQFLSDVTSSLIPGDALSDVIEQAKIGDYVISDLGATVRVTDSGLGVEFSFLGGKGTKRNRFRLTVNRGIWGSDKGLGVALSGEFSNLRPLDSIRDLTGVDLSFLPVIGDLHVPSLVLIAATKQVNNLIIPLGVADFPEISSTTKGITILFSTSIVNSNDTRTFQVSFSLSHFSFVLPQESKISVKDLLSGALDSLQVSLPSFFSLDGFLTQTIDEFSYDVGTKTLHVVISHPGSISLIDEGLVFTDSSLSLDYTFSAQPGSKFGVVLASTWEIRDVHVALTVAKPLGSKTWMAEGRPDVDIPIGAHHTEVCRIRHTSRPD